MGVQCLIGICEQFIGNSLLIESYIGVGVRYKKEGLYHEPGSVYDNDGGWLNRKFFPVIPVGLRIIYHFR